MKIKLNAAVFHDAMSYNSITIDENKIRIHSFDGAGMGIIRAAKLESEAEETASFVLSAKDYMFMSKLGDFSLEFVNDVIKVSNAKIKAKFANIKDYPVYTPMINNMVEINVKLEDLIPGTQFLGNDPSYPQSSGVNIFTDKIIASDKSMFYNHSCKTGLTEPINVPDKAFKYFMNSDSTKLLTNNKMLVSKTPGRSFYTVLIEQKLPDVKLEDTPIYTASVSKDELIQALKLIKDYSKYVTISHVKKALKLYTGEQDNELSIQVVATVEGETQELSYDVSKLLKIMMTVKEDTVSILFGARMMIIDEPSSNNRYVLARYFMDVKKSDNKEDVKNG